MGTINNPYYEEGEPSEETFTQKAELKVIDVEDVAEDATINQLVPYNTSAALELQSNPVTKWAGEGYDITEQLNTEADIQKMLLKNGLDWKTLKRPIAVASDALEYAEQPITDHSALLRSDNGYVLDIVGRKYKPVSNVDAFSLFNVFLKAGDMHLDSAGSFKHGKYVWGLAKLKQEICLNGTDKSVGYMLISCPHVQGYSLVMKLITKRITCWNSYQAALGEETPTIKMTHKADFNQFKTVAQRTVEGFNQSFLEYSGDLQALNSFSMSFKEAEPMLNNIYNASGEGFKERRIYKDLELAYERQPMAEGQKRETAYSVFNAVTYYHTHMQGRTAEGRLYNQFLGKAALQSRQMFNSLLDLAA